MEINKLVWKGKQYKKPFQIWHVGYRDERVPVNSYELSVYNFACFDFLHYFGYLGSSFFCGCLSR